MSDKGELNPVVYSKNVVEFVTVANEYCGTVEKVNELPVEEGLQKLQKMLPLLYLKGPCSPRPKKCWRTSWKNM